MLIPFDRRRAEIWNPIAEELGVTWQSADAMHWTLGKEGMTRRIYEFDSHSEQCGSCESINETKSDSLYNTPEMQQFEDCRVHHFNATRPPQVQLPSPVSPQATVGYALSPRVSSTDLDRSASVTIDDNGASNLVVEGRRQVSQVVPY